MRRLLLSTIGALALTGGSAIAADIPMRPMPAKAPAYMPAPFNWTGFYLGINGGYAWGNSNWDSLASSTNVSGALVGGTAGYNWQRPGSPFVFGLEGDMAWSDIRGSFANVACPIGCETRNEWLGTVRGRLGYSIDRTMLYFTGGLAVGEISARPTGFAGASSTNAGWTVGAGVETAFANNWSAKLEYLYVDLGSIGCSAANCGVATNVDFDSHVVRAGLNFRF